jgi:Nucleosome assembly protein (NAP)
MCDVLRDKLVLEYLEDVRWTRGDVGMCAEFFFAENNPFFTNTVLRRGLYVEEGPDGQAVVREQSTFIDWKDGKDVTLKCVAKKV